MFIMVKRVPLLKRIVLLPRTFARHYMIGRRYMGRMASASLAMRLCLLVIKP